MDSKFYVSLEAARLLKEKGYNEKCIFAYADTSNGSDINGRIVFNSNDYPIGFYPCSTKTEVIDWLESKRIIIELSATHDLCHWVFSIYMKGGEDILTNTDFDFESFPTRLEAEEAAIIKALELL